MLLPRPVGVGDAHLQDTAVAVDVLDDQALDWLLVVRITARAGADQDRMVGQRPLGAVRIDAWTDVERARIQATRNVRIVTGALEHRIYEVQARGAGQKRWCLT